MSFTDYQAGGGGATRGTGAAASDQSYPAVGKLKKQYLNYLSAKRQEIEEQQIARRYRHGAQYTSDQYEILKKRKQPPVIYNEIGRKINGTVGTIERQRQDPKAYPRTPKHEDGAELATAVLRYVLDENEWPAKSPIVGSDASTDGLAGVEILIEAGDQGDPDVGIEIVEPENFFYDPRSYRLDFSDARYMGVGKWVDIDQAKEMFPDKADELSATLDGSDLSTHSDKEARWFSSENNSIRIIDHWYKHKGKWCYTIYTSSLKLMEGVSYLVDEKGETYCKYVMFSANVDHDGDRYGLVRQLKSAQDEINARGSKGLHELNTRRILAEKGAFDDVEVARREAARPDGIVERNPGLEAAFDDTAKMANLEGQLKFLERAQNRIDNYGPNLALVGGDSGDTASGRAIQLTMQAGMAELGPFLIAYRNWKVRVYRAVFNAVQRYWKAERWIRVTDNEGLAQFIQINGMQAGPYGAQLVNAIGSLDVDIILDEGPDTVTAMQDMYQTLSDILPAMAPMLQPAQAQAVVGMLVETSPLDSAKKKTFREASQQGQQPDPMQEQAKQAELQQAFGKAREINASADLKEAQTAKTMVDAQLAPMQGMEQAPPMQPEGYEPPPHLQDAKVASEIELNQAKAEHTRASAFKTHQEAALAPEQMRMDAQNAAEDRELTARQFQQRNKGNR